MEVFGWRELKTYFIKQEDFFFTTKCHGGYLTRENILTGNVFFVQNTCYDLEADSCYYNGKGKLMIYKLIIFLILIVSVNTFANDASDLENARQLLYLSGNLNDGKVALEQFLIDWPQSPLIPLARIHLANYYVKTANYNEALTRLSNVYSDFPQHEQGRYAYHYVGTVLAQKGNIDLAEQRYLGTINKFTDYNDIVYLSYRELANMFLKARRFQKAYDYYGQLMALPDYNDQPQQVKDQMQDYREYAFYSVGDNFAEAGDSNAAEVRYKQVLIQLSHREDLVYLANKSLANLFIYQQQYQEAVPFITAALSFPSIDPELRESLDAHRVLAQIETAGLLNRTSIDPSEIDSVRDILKSSYPINVVSRGLVLAAEQYLIPAVRDTNEIQYQIGLKFLDSQLADFPDSDMGHFQYGNFAYQYRDYDTALTHLEQVSDNFGYYSSCAKYRLGEIYRTEGQLEAAKAAFQDVVDNFPESPFVKNAQVQLKELTK